MRTAGGILVYHYSCKTNPTEDITVIYLVRPRKPHYFTSEVFYSNTLKPFQSPIESHSVLLQNVTLETIGIERCVDNKDENPTTWKIYFLSDGWVIFYQLHHFLLYNTCCLVPRLHLTLVFNHALYHATIHRNWNIKGQTGGRLTVLCVIWLKLLDSPTCSSEFLPKYSLFCTRESS